MTIKRITFNDNIRSEVGKSVAFLNGSTGEVSLTVYGETGTVFSFTIYTNREDAVSRSRVLDQLRDLYTAIGELLVEVNARGDRT